MRRYSLLSSYLHWLLAIFFIALLLSGWSMYFELWTSKQFVFKLFQWHKSIGVLVLLLVAVRVCWRIKTKPPELPAELESQARKIKTGHILMYVLIIVMPLSGWMLVSSNPKGIPTLVFGLFEWLHLPLPNAAFELSSWLHFYVAIIFSIFIVGHIAMAAHHHLQGIEIFQRILPSRSVKMAILISVLFISVLSIFVFLPNHMNSSDASNSKVSESGNTNPAKVNKISFSGEHAGNMFNGTFAEWDLDTDINFSQQTMSSFDLEVSINSVKTGSSLNDKTLMEEDWFNVAEYPMATFKSDNAEFLDTNRVKIIGQFKIKDIVKSLELVLIYQDSVLSTEFVIKRSDYLLGQEADAEAEWVSEEIIVQANVVIEK